MTPLWKRCVAAAHRLPYNANLMIESIACALGGAFQPHEKLTIHLNQSFLRKERFYATRSKKKQTRAAFPQRKTA